MIIPEKVPKQKNEEKSTNYTYTSEVWDCCEIDINNIFSFTIAIEITNDFGLQTINECKQRYDWPQ